MSKHKDSVTTQMLHTRIDTTTAFPSVTPLYQNSSFEATSSFFYSRKANPNCTELESAVSKLENAAHTLCVSTGMAAITLLISQIKVGSRVLLHPTLYGCTLKLFQRMSERFNFDLEIVDLTQVEALAKSSSPISLVFFETPTNPFLQHISIADVARVVKVKNPNALIVVDNTWATPLRQRPLDCGADVSLQSGTKYFSGHSDVMGGFLSCNSENLYMNLCEERFYQGMILDAHSAWLLRRSLQTLKVRLDVQEKTCVGIAAWLRARPEVEHVYTSTPDPNQLSGSGAILFFQFKKDFEKYYINFRDCLKLFRSGTGMACVVSMVAQPVSGSHASLSESEKKEMGLTPGLVRLCFGLEDAADLIADLDFALNYLNHAVKQPVNQGVKQTSFLEENLLPARAEESHL